MEAKEYLNTRNGFHKIIITQLHYSCIFAEHIKYNVTGRPFTCFYIRFVHDKFTQYPDMVTLLIFVGI